MEDIIAKLGKLIAHEKSARAVGSVEEAESFAAKIQEMLFKHKLEMSDLEFAGQEQSEPIAEEFVDEVRFAEKMVRRRRWVSTLVEAVARMNFCRVIHNRYWPSVTVIGRSSDRVAAVAMIRYLYGACLECADAMAKTRMWDKREFKAGFKHGFVRAIEQRLVRGRAKLVAGLNEQGLIRIDVIEKALDDAADQFGTEVVRPRPIRTSREGYEAGKKYGGVIGINTTARLKA